MPYSESYDIVAFKSRQHAFHFNQILRDGGISTQLMSTPRGVSLGCGISIRFSTYMTQRVIGLYKETSIEIIGFYHIEKTGNNLHISMIPVG
ncbi:MAG TPA: DUF3343 domain-containing protein [Bacillota bacterium]|nr:DUF3343 domain-containing protein [Bacillota bacterium]